MPGPALVALDIAGAPDPWSALGLQVADGVAQCGATTLRFGSAGEGIVSWALQGAEGPTELDGLSTRWLPAPVTPNAPLEHALGVVAVDHVVVRTPNPERTFAAFVAAGMVLRLERDAGHGLRQGFFRHGEARVEVVGPAEVVEDGAARFWGLTLTVEDLDAAVAGLGAERCSAAKDAVQPGRRIASVRRPAGLPVPVALISPEA